MKKIISMFMFAMVLSVGMASFSYAADAMAPASTKTLQGDLLKIDGEFYVMKDLAGKEIRLHVDKTTALEGVIKSGDRIEAQATETNHAASIKHVPSKM